MLHVACCVGSDHKGAFLLVHLLGVSVFSVCTRFHHQYRRRTDGYLYRLTNHPMMILVRKAPIGSISLAVRKSQKSINDMPKSPIFVLAPTEREQNTAMTEQTTVRIHVAWLRGNRSSSWKKAVPISCIEIVEVRAAKTSNA